MACSCTNTLTKNYWIIYSSGTFQVTEPYSGGPVVTACKGSLYINLTTHDCVRVVFTYQPSGGPAILPMSVNANCPCEVANGSGAPPPAVTYEARFKPAAGTSCTYLWLLYSAQPTCEIKIIVAKS
jgi:hypothetical protein